MWFCVKDWGSLISVVESPEWNTLKGLNDKFLKNMFFVVKPKGRQVAEISRLLDEGCIRPRWTVEFGGL